MCSELLVERSLKRLELRVSYADNWIRRAYRVINNFRGFRRPDSIKF